MKKLVTLFWGLALAISFVSAQSYWDKYIVNENFTGWFAWPSGWSQAVTGGGAVAIADSIRYYGSGSGNRGADMVFPFYTDSSTVYVNFDLFIASATVARNNAFALFLSGTNSGAISTSTAFNDLITGVYLAGTSKKFHVWNMDIKGPVPVAKPDTIVPAFTWGAFARPGTSNTICDSINASTKTNVDYVTNKWYNLIFKLNFATKMMDITITQKDNEINTQTITDLKFISNTANDIKRIGMMNTRSTTSYIGVTGATAVGNGANANLSAFLDNLKVYRKVLSQGKADVTINYLDQDGLVAKTARTESAREVNVAYKLAESDKMSFVGNNNYYAYDAVSTGADSVIVAAQGSAINVKFKKTPLTAGTYVWNGNVSENWNELDANFTASGTQIGYQNGNGVALSDANALFKNVLINAAADLGSNNLSVETEGYTLTGTGKLVGTGAINVNASTKISVMNNLTGGVNLNNGTLEVGHIRTISKLNAKDGTKLNVLTGTGNFNAPITGAGTFTLIPTDNVTYSSTIKGVSTMNYVLKVKGNPAATTKGMPILNNILDSAALINVTTLRGDTTFFGPTIDFKKNRIHLGDSVDLVYGQNPVAGGTTTVTIGELSGTASSRFVGCYIRSMTYIIGTLNTDAAFNGKFKPVTTAYWGTSTTDKSQTNFNINKVGKGKWTLNGSSPKYFGNVKVLDGTLEVNDTLCNATGEYVFGTTTLTTVPNKIPELMVADTATLAGKGFIGATSTVLNGTITGNLTLAGSLSMKAASGDNVGAKTIINVTSTAVDKIKVVGDLYYGGKLKINVISLPQPGDYKILEFGGFLESGPNGFDSIELPSANWSFDYTTGILKYKGGDESAVNAIDYTKQIESVRYFDVAGKQVTKNHIGFVFMKIKYTDGTTASVKTYVKK